MKAGQKTKSLVEALNFVIGDDPEMKEMIARARRRRELAERIYAARMKRGLSQVELAKLVGTSQSTIARIEQANTTSGPTVKTLERLAFALDLNLTVSLSEKRKRAA
ncbi:MAG: helix-turn-helix transcriptional regulator [bacterium]